MNAQRLYIFVLTVTYMLVAADEGGVCDVEQHPNGTTTFYLKKTVPQDPDYSWQINGTNYANKEYFDNTIVVSRGPHFVTFQRCHENVTYRTAHTIKPFNCSYNCFTMKPSKDLQKDQPTPPTLSTGVRSTIAGVVLAVALALHFSQALLVAGL